MGCNIPDIDVVVQWKLPAKLSSFIQRAGRAARGPGRTGIAILLVEPTAYSAVLEDLEKEDGVNGLPGKKRTAQNAKGKKKGAPKNYARSRGRYRGGLTCDDDLVPLADQLEPDAEAIDEGLHHLVQTTTCRREVLRKIFDNPQLAPLVQCCDICCPDLLNLTRPGLKPESSRQPRIKCHAEKNLAVEDALANWREATLEKDFPGSYLTPSCILPDIAINVLASLIEVTAHTIEKYLKHNWDMWAKYGQVITLLVITASNCVPLDESDPQEESAVIVPSQPIGSIIATHSSGLKRSITDSADDPTTALPPKRKRASAEAREGLSYTHAPSRGVQELPIVPSMPREMYPIPIVNYPPYHAPPIQGFELTPKPTNPRCNDHTQQYRPISITSAERSVSQTFQSISTVTPQLRAGGVTAARGTQRHHFWWPNLQTQPPSNSHHYFPPDEHSTSMLHHPAQHSMLYPQTPARAQSLLTQIAPSTGTNSRHHRDHENAPGPSYLPFHQYFNMYK